MAELGAAVLPIGGYVLAGGKSSRMGSDKALAEIGGKPLIAHAVEKLRRICADVRILSNSPALASYAPLIPDLHKDCGPLGGIQAALAHSSHRWNLLLPVDVPFLPVGFLASWVSRVTDQQQLRVAYFDISGKPQPTVLLVRREAEPSIRASIDRGEFKLLPAIRAAAGPSGPYVESLESSEAEEWFANVNTPEELQRARSGPTLGKSEPPR